jgi:hypothetical protein
MSHAPTLRALVVAAALSGLAAGPALAFESLDEVRCVCADGALNTGDFVSCTSHLSRRLEVHGLISAAERRDAVREASDADLDAVLATCPTGGGGAQEGWGVSVEIEDAFWPAMFGTGMIPAVRGTVRLWNATGKDVYQTTQWGPDTDGCTFQVSVIDAQGRQVRAPDTWACYPEMGTLDVPSGTVLERTFLTGLGAQDPDPATGLVSGDHLPAGIYRIRVEWMVDGPQEEPGTILDGGLPAAEITVRVGPAEGGGGGRTLP